MKYTQSKEDVSKLAHTLTSKNVLITSLLFIIPVFVPLVRKENGRILLLPAKPAIKIIYKVIILELQTEPVKIQLAYRP